MLKNPIRLTPVHLYADISAVFLSNILRDISQDEEAMLIKSLNESLGSQEQYFYVSEERKWYFTSSNHDDFISANPERLIGKNIFPFLPTAPELKKLFAEIQMLLQNHPVNTLRVSQNKIPINALWLSMESKTPFWKKLIKKFYE